ncbi:MAG: hypothetical protein BIFFINMI_01765 [Phycisphaerae bacterium]|nr:hypothetical protein [Phycisphaerae bacterium]
MPMRRTARCILAALAALLVASARPAFAGPLDPITATKLSTDLGRLEAMIALGWWERAQSAYDDLAGQIKFKNIANNVVADRMARAKTALDARAAGPSPGGDSARFDALLKRIGDRDRRFPVDKYRKVIVDPDGGGDYRTLSNALAASAQTDVIVLRTGIYPISKFDLEGDRRTQRARVFYADAGHWPRVVPAKDEDWAFVDRCFVDGVEVLPGKRGVSNSQMLDLANCYLRSAAVPDPKAAGPDGIASGDHVEVTDTVFCNLRVAAHSPRLGSLDNCLFVTCVEAVKGSGQMRVWPKQSAFYRCMTALSARQGTVAECLFSRVLNVALDKAVQQDRCVENDDPFVNPFRGDFRIKPAVQVEGKPPGPRWSDDRWELFIANWNLAPDAPPQSLARVRDPDAAARLADARQAAADKQWAKAAADLSALTGPCRDCPSAKAAADEIGRLCDATLDGLVATGQVPTPAAAQAARQQAQDLLAQARASYKAGKKDEAVDAASKAVEADTDFLEGRMTLAQWLAESGRPRQARLYLTRAGELIDAYADRVDVQTRSNFLKLSAELDQKLVHRRDWDHLSADYAGKYLAQASQPGQPSTALSLRRVALLKGLDETQRKQLSDAESAMVPLIKRPADKPDPNKAKEDRDEAGKLLAGQQYTQAMDRWVDAYSLDPQPDDLIKLAQCYMRKKQPQQAALLALIARQQATAANDGSSVTAAAAILRIADPALGRIELIDADLSMVGERKADLADKSGDQETADAIRRAMGELGKIDARILSSLKLPPPPTKQ